MDAMLIITSLSVVVFGILPFFLRSNASLVFFALCAGELLSRLTAQDATQILRSLPSMSNLPSYSIVQIILLLIPPLVLLFAYKNTQRPSQLFLHIIPAVASVVVCVMLVVAKLPYDTKQLVEDSQVFVTLQPFFSLSVAAGLLSATVFLVSAKTRLHKDDKKGKK